MTLHLNVLMQIPNQEPKEFKYEFADGAKVSLGRDEGNDIQIPLSTVSRTHAEIFSQQGEWFIEDKKSTHGTKHNGRPLQGGAKKLLREGDTLDIVHFSITIGIVKDDENFGGAEGTAALAQKMVQEVLQSIGKEKLPYVRVMNGPDEGRTFEIKSDINQILIGRGNDCDFQVNDANISRRHAIIKRDWADITIEDAGSKNGVIINERKIAKATSLRDADEVLLGAVRITFIDPAAKYIGKLDDIPALATENTADADEELPEEEPEEEIPEEVPVENAAAETVQGEDFNDDEMSAMSVGGDIPSPVSDPGVDDDELPNISEENSDAGGGSFNPNTLVATPKSGGIGSLEIVLGVGLVAVVATVIGVIVWLLFG